MIIITRKIFVLSFHYSFIFSFIHSDFCIKGCGSPQMKKIQTDVYINTIYELIFQGKLLVHKRVLRLSLGNGTLNKLNLMSLLQNLTNTYCSN